MIISIVIPAFNEEDNIKDVVEDSISVLKGLGSGNEVLVINDCSKDNTGQILNSLKNIHPELSVIHNRNNIGCHPSSLIGFREAKGEAIFFIPADKQILPREVYKCIKKVEEGYDVVVTNRAKRADPFYRILIGKTYNLIIRSMLGSNFHDVDSSSMYTKKVLNEVLDKIKANSAFTAAEMLCYSVKSGFKVAEVDIEHFQRNAGIAKGINPHDLINVPANLLRLGFKLRKIMKNK